MSRVSWRDGLCMSWMSSGIRMRLTRRRCMWLGMRGRRWTGGLIDEAFGTNISPATSLLWICQALFKHYISTFVTSSIYLQLGRFHSHVLGLEYCPPARIISLVLPFLNSHHLHQTIGSIHRSSGTRGKRSLVQSPHAPRLSQLARVCRLFLPHPERTPPRTLEHSRALRGK